MRELDYGKGYLYAHDVEGKVAAMECLPTSLAGRRYYQTNRVRVGSDSWRARMQEIAREETRSHGRSGDL